MLEYLYIVHGVLYTHLSSCSFKFAHKSEEFIKYCNHAEIIETKEREEMALFCKKSNYKYYFVFQTSLIAIFEIVNLPNVKINFLLNLISLYDNKSKMKETVSKFRFALSYKLNIGILVRNQSFKLFSSTLIRRPQLACINWLQCS